MSKYFEFYNIAKYPELKFIREYLDKLGELHCADRELERLWCEFSEESYSAGCVIPEEPIIYEFANWLAGYDEKETN